jgi:hypothetical protein
MSCNTCGGNGCTCGPVRINPVYPECPGGEPCDTVVDFACVRYKGDDLADFPLSSGDRLSRFMQMMVLREIAPADFDGIDSVHAPYWIESIAKTDTTIDFQWDSTGDAWDYIISYSTNNATWTDITGVDAQKDSYQLINLTPSTKYYIKVGSALNGGTPGPFYSLTIEVTTNA